MKGNDLESQGSYEEEPVNILSRYTSHDTVPLDMSKSTGDAISRQISKIQSRRSINEQNIPLIAQLLDDEKDKNLSAINSVSSTVDTVNTDAKYGRFSPTMKYLCVFMASLAGFLTPLSSLAYLPAVPEIAAQFNTTGEIINVSNAVYCIFMALSPCVFSPCSDVYGRKATFLVCTCLFTITTIIVGVSQNLAMFFVFRSLSAFFGTSFFSIGAHIIGDIFVPTERGTYMAWLIAGSQIGNSFGAVFGGIVVQFTSWRVIFYALGGLGALVFILAALFLPETAVEVKYRKVLEEVRKDKPNKKFVFVPINPFGVIKALRFPNLFIDGWIVITVMFTFYNLLTPIGYVMVPRFNLTEPIYSGLFYLPSGLGYIVGTLFGGKFADYYVKKYIKIRGRRVAEDRIRSILIPIGFVYPVSMLIYGWCIEYEKGGMAVPIIFMFFSGVAQTFIFPATNTYCVDSMPEIGGDGIGSSYFSRYLAAGVSSATCLKSIDSIGVGWSCTISAIVLWTGFISAIVLIKWGEKLRINSLIRAGLRSPDDTDVSI